MDILVVRSVAHWGEAGLKGCGPAHIFHTLPVEMPWKSAWTLNGTRLARVPKVRPPHVARIRRGRGHVVEVVHRRCLTKNNHRTSRSSEFSIEPGPS